MKFKPQIKQIIEQNEMNPVLLIPKNGGLKGILEDSVKSMGVDEGIQVFTYRGEDIPKVVEDYYFDRKMKVLGFTGDDLFDEYKLRNPNSLVEIIETIDWDDNSAMFRRPCLALLGKEGERKTGKVQVAVGKKYEYTCKIALDELKQELGIEPQINLYSGNLEETVAEGINDYCIDIIYSGKSMQEKGLEIVTKIRYSDFVLIGITEKNVGVINAEYNQILSRKENPVQGSYSAGLIADANKAAKKFGEETTEFMRACTEYDCNPTTDNMGKMIGEAADVFYALEVNLARRDAKLGDFLQEITKRVKKM